MERSLRRHPRRGLMRIASVAIDQSKRGVDQGGNHCLAEQPQNAREHIDTGHYVDSIAISGVLSRRESHGRNGAPACFHAPRFPMAHSGQQHRARFSKRVAADRVAARCSESARARARGRCVSVGYFPRFTGTNRNTVEFSPAQLSAPIAAISPALLIACP
jgi:hypothetical protein